MPGLSLLARAPRPVWKVVWRGIDWPGDFLIARELNALRATLGLAPTRRVLRNWFSRQRLIGMFPDKLFPRCAAVVHHGGIGTVAKGIAAGVPQLVFPICFDQGDNGVRVKRLGAGDCLRASRPTGRQIALALQPLLTAEARVRCRPLQARCEGSDALARAADLVEQLAVAFPTSIELP